MNAPWLSEVAWRRAIVQADRRFRWGRLGQDYVGEWVGLLLLRLDPNGEIKTAIGAPDVSPASLEKITNGEGAAFARSIRGKVSLHAAAVAIGASGVVLSGLSGSGKSTAAFHLCSSHGGELLADDITGLDVAGDAAVFAEPRERFSWLCDGHGDKHPRPVRIAERAVGLGALVRLGFDDRLREAELRPVRGARAVSHVLDALLRFDVGFETWASEFEVATALAASVPVFDLERPLATPSEEIAELVVSLVQLIGDQSLPKTPGQCRG